MRLLVIIVSVLFLTVSARAQGPSSADDSNSSSPQTTRAPEMVQSPRATMRSFLASVEALLGGEGGVHELRAGQDPTAVLRATLGLESTVDANSTRDIGIRLYAVLHRIDDFSGHTLDSDSLYTRRDLSQINEQGLELPTRVQIWPWGGTLAPAGRDSSGQVTFVDDQRVRLLEREFASSGINPNISLIRMGDDDRWVFAPETIRDVDSAYDALRGLPQPFGIATNDATLSMWIENLLPEWALRKDFTLRNWQWLGLGLILFVGFVADLITRTVLQGFWTRYRRREARRAGEDLEAFEIGSGRRMVRPFGLLIGATVWYWGVAALGLPPLWATVLQVAARVVLTLAGILAAWRVTDALGYIALHHTAKTTSKIDDLLVPLIRKTLKILVVVFGVVYVAKSLSLDIGPVLAGLGVGGLAFAFAAKDTIENLFGSVAVLLDRPFQVGDWVVVDGTEGTVEELGLRSTRIRTFYNSQVTVPNAALVRAVVDNYGRRRFRRYKTTLNVTYDTAPDSIEAFCEGIRELIRVHPYTRKDQFHVWMNDFGPHSLDILVYMFFECPDWATELRERHRFILDITRLANRLGVEFAFPTQTLHLQNAGRAPKADAVADLAFDTERKARGVGLKAARGLTQDAVWRDVKPAPVAFSADSKSEVDDLGPDGDGGDGGR